MNKFKETFLAQFNLVFKISCMVYTVKSFKKVYTKIIITEQKCAAYQVYQEILECLIYDQWYIFRQEE